MGDVICDLISWQKVKEKVNPSGWRLKVSDVNRIWRDSWAITKPTDDSLAEFKINTKTDVDVIITEHIFVSSKKRPKKKSTFEFLFRECFKVYSWYFLRFNDLRLFLRSPLFVTVAAFHSDHIEFKRGASENLHWLWTRFSNAPNHWFVFFSGACPLSHDSHLSHRKLRTIVKKLYNRAITISLVALVNTLIHQSAELLRRTCGHMELN